MNFIDIDLHKKTTSVCLVNQERKVLKRQTLNCAEPAKIVAFFRPTPTATGVCAQTSATASCWHVVSMSFAGLFLNLRNPDNLDELAIKKGRLFRSWSNNGKIL